MFWPCQSAIPYHFVPNRERTVRIIERARAAVSRRDSGFRQNGGGDAEVCPIFHHLVAQCLARILLQLQSVLSEDFPRRVGQPTTYGQREAFGRDLLQANRPGTRRLMSGRVSR